MPYNYGWSTVKEGESIGFELKTTGGKSKEVTYSIVNGKVPEMKLDSVTGAFSWTPSYDVADRLITSVAVSVLFEARNKADEVNSQEVVFKVVHTNRPPVVDELKPFYVQFKTQNTYRVDPESVRDLDNDSFVFIPILETMPEGMQMSEAGQITWDPSIAQFNILKAGPRYVEFYVEDQPFKARTKARLKLEPTQKDLAPVITVVPKQSVFRIKENSLVNIKFYLSDPNGDDDIARFDFVSQNKEISKKALVKNTETNYEFIWEPGFDFVKEPVDSVRFSITFYVIDKAQNRDERVFNFVVGNTVDEEKRNEYWFNLYHEAMVSARDLMDQMVEKENDLKRNYRKAKRGKSQRSVLNATMGASTGLSPVIAKDKPDLRNQMTVIGGTTVATIGTLEATEVIGKSIKDLLDRFNYVLEKKTELQGKGDAFAREFASKTARAHPDFVKKLDAFKSSMSVRGLVALELDANWVSKTQATTKEIRKYFKDYMPLNESAN
ncbi:hypothetical protein GCM10023091_38800 [Ravibacter arvi]|uniref:Uncharacterized protein n=2 Tax=Ravibacter arvi TaxID=2051041 RepID=A0ABP8MB99_9BACT